MRERGDVEVERGGGGWLGLQISNAIGRLHKDFVGRGPEKVRTYIDDDLVLCLLEGGFTRAERTLERHAGYEAVVQLRLQLQAAMRESIIDTVREILGREVRCFMSANDPAHNLQVEIMLLAPGVVEREDAASSQELSQRSRRAMELARSLREDQTALMAEQRQSYESLRRRASKLGGEDRPPKR
jgi:uncharacterized protein YbcI